MNRAQIELLAEAVQSGDRSALARAITLVESSLDQDRDDSELLLWNRIYLSFLSSEI